MQASLKNKLDDPKSGYDVVAMFKNEKDRNDLKETILFQYKNDLKCFAVLDDPENNLYQFAWTHISS